MCHNDYVVVVGVERLVYELKKKLIPPQYDEYKVIVAALTTIKYHFLANLHLKKIFSFFEEF